MEVPMARKGRKIKDTLKLTPQEAESLGVELEQEGRVTFSEKVHELPMHEQVVGALTEDDVAEALTGEVTAESREDVEEAVGDMQEDAAENEDAP
jgi:hypothetical protein